MKATTAQALRDKTVAELRHREHELAEQIFALRMQNATRRLEKSHKVREAKRELARVLTVLKEKQS